MHWFWRATIAVAAGLLAYEITHHGFMARSIYNAMDWINGLINANGVMTPYESLIGRSISTLIHGSLSLVVAVAVYGTIPARPNEAGHADSSGLWNKNKLVRFALASTCGFLSGAAVGSLFIHRGLRFDIWLFAAIATGCVVSLGAHSLLSYPAQVVNAHYCECGYNLTGNESGVCPECGEKIESW